MLQKTNKRSISRLLRTATDISLVSASEANTISYIPRFLANISLPARCVNGNEYTRRNGRYKLHLLSPGEIGLPYGSYPRLLIIHLTTRAKITGCSEVFLGHSHAQFLKSMGIKSSGGKNGSLRAFKDQTRRLLASTILWCSSGHSSWNMESMRIAKEVAMTWEPMNPTEWEAYLKLDHEFFADIASNAVPIDQRVIEACSYYPMAIDIYCWLTHRYYKMSQSQLITWEQLANQFGNVYTRKSHFKGRFITALDRISLMYRTAKFSTNGKGLILYPSPPHVSPKAAQNFNKPT